MKTKKLKDKRICKAKSQDRLHAMRSVSSEARVSPVSCGSSPLSTWTVQMYVTHWRWLGSCSWRRIAFPLDRRFPNIGSSKSLLCPQPTIFSLHPSLSITGTVDGTSMRWPDFAATPPCSTLWGQAFLEGIEAVWREFWEVKPFSNAWLN